MARHLDQAGGSCGSQGPPGVCPGPPRRCARRPRPLSCSAQATAPCDGRRQREVGGEDPEGGVTVSPGAASARPARADRGVPLTTRARLLVGRLPRHADGRDRAFGLGAPHAATRAYRRGVLPRRLGDAHRVGQAATGGRHELDVELLRRGRSGPRHVAKPGRHTPRSEAVSSYTLRPCALAPTTVALAHGPCPHQTGLLGHLNVTVTDPAFTGSARRSGAWANRARSRSAWADSSTHTTTRATCR